MSRRHVYAVKGRALIIALYETKAAADHRAKLMNAIDGGERWLVRRLPVYTSATRKAKRTR